MKKNKILLFLLAIVLLLSFKKVDADTHSGAWSYLFHNQYTCKTNEPFYKFTTIEIVNNEALTFSENDAYTSVPIKYYGIIENPSLLPKLYVSFESTVSDFKFGATATITDAEGNGYISIPRKAADRKLTEKYELKSVRVYNDGNCYTYYTYEKEGAKKIKVSNSTVTINPDTEGKSDSNAPTGQIYESAIHPNSEKVKAGDKVYIAFNVLGKDLIEHAAVVFKDGTTNSYIQRNVIDPNRIEGDSYIELEKDDAPGNYSVVEVFAIFKSGKMYRYVANTGNAIYGTPFEASIDSFTITDPSSEIIPQYNFTKRGYKLKSTSQSVGGKVYVKITDSEYLSSIMYTFYDEENGNSFSTYLKNIKDEPYFIIPSSTEPGIYKLKNVIIKTSVGGIILQDSMTDPDALEILNQTLTVKKAESMSQLYIDNTRFDEDALRLIKNSKEDAVITVICGPNSLISSEFFKVIKDSKRMLIIDYGQTEWVFNGSDIKDVKDIDATMAYVKINEADLTSSISNAIDEDSVVIEFPNNGELPGKTLIRLSAKELSSYIKGDKFFVYYIDEDNNKLDKVAMEIQKSDNGYVEFYIDHNSKYVISSKEAAESVISKNEDMLKLNSEVSAGAKSDNTMLYIILGAAGVVIVLLVIALIRVKSSKKEEPVKPVEAPKPEAPVVPEEKKEEALPAEPVKEADPVVESPTVETPVVEEPAVEETPVAEEPKVEDAAVEEPKQE
jgi:hypothetical protein